MKIALLGSGNVATHLGKALKLNGHEIIQVWSKTLTHALELGEILDSKYTDNLTDLTPDAELYIISVSDDAIKEVASRIALSNKIIVHTSGTTEIDIPGISGVFYPIQTFSKQKNVDFSKIPIAIEGRNSEITEVLIAFARSLSLKVVQLDSKQRKVVHIAAVFACNFSNYLYTIAAEILSKESIEFDLIRPLITETADKVNYNLPSVVQTGPAVRKDETTLNKHRQYLETNSDFKVLYEMLSQSIINFYQKA